MKRTDVVAHESWFRLKMQLFRRALVARSFATKATHPREYAIWKKLDRDNDNFLSHAEIRDMCRKFDATEHAGVLSWILDPEGKGGVDFTGFCEKFKAVQMVRNASRLKHWHRTFGLGVAGNVAGHMQQAGEADDSHSSNMPAAVFTFYAPHPHTVDATEDEVLGRLANFPVSNAVIDFPRLGGNVQVEPEMGLLCDSVHQGREGSGTLGSPSSGSLQRLLHSTVGWLVQVEREEELGRWQQRNQPQKLSGELNFKGLLCRPALLGFLHQAG